MSSRYRVDYHLKSHRKDEFIQWIKGLLSVPFVLHAVNNHAVAQDKYRRIFKDVESLVQERIELQGNNGELHVSRLQLLVPTIGEFFTGLPLSEAFLLQDQKRAISARVRVSPSFNDIRHILNTAQMLELARSKNLRMMTFDGDVTLYADGGTLNVGDKAVSRLVKLLEIGIYVAIVTAAGYDDALNYERRLIGLIKKLEEHQEVPLGVKERLCIMGGESNFLFKYYERERKGGFKRVNYNEWMLNDLRNWTHEDIKATLDLAEETFKSMLVLLNLPPETSIIRKERSVGIVPGYRWDPELKIETKVPILRESLEEIVLRVEAKLESFVPAKRIMFSCFDGGSDVWCDIGGKDLGIRQLQHYYSSEKPFTPQQCLHVGDQFTPLGSANDFKARLSSCTVWIASPQETVDVLDEFLSYVDTSVH
ncbi:HHL252Wp [Eremothecium sinecaudum]|uniref:IMP-specific 5'-nucleotidase 1 n=1 Tax=Eremothecium sinecaudum TaxID=45286 RepID=A0A109V0L0_9SACH|nr:HHL252Wp [Eremothecium sinecaudum]AMD22518.1 HHL252Wp [Eremothecium sinecaudum]